MRTDQADTLDSDTGRDGARLPRPRS